MDYQRVVSGAEEGSAGGSAGADCSALARPRDAELFHLRLQGRSFHAKPGGGAIRTAQYPVGFAQGSQDVLALGLGQRNAAIPIAIGRGDSLRSRGLQIANGNLQRSSRTENHGPLNDVLQLANI